MKPSDRKGTALEKPQAYAWEKEYKTGRGMWKGTTNFALNLPSGSKILEIGCGNGKHLSSFFNKGYDVYAMDVSPTAIELAKDRAKISKAKVHFYVGDASKLDFKDGFFDCVFMFHLLAHLSLEDQAKAVFEAFRVLKKGGKCYFRDFHVSDYRFGKGIEVEKNTFRRGTNVWVHYFTEEELKEMFRKAGFGVEKIILDSYKHIFRGEAFGRCEMDGVFVKKA
ncbi:class I SAM-dependent methyltransferase [Candidatus Micrarchaeota archaeon]|nr:class I SAM-dependent methyltransferase [Candidatus Micrarchaeota archaeon]